MAWALISLPVFLFMATLPLGTSEGHSVVTWWLAAYYSFDAALLLPMLAVLTLNAALHISEQVAPTLTLTLTQTLNLTLPPTLTLTLRISLCLDPRI